MSRLKFLQRAIENHSCRKEVPDPSQPSLHWDDNHIDARLIQADFTLKLFATSILVSIQNGIQQEEFQKYPNFGNYWNQRQQIQMGCSSSSFQ
jgi:hypothetical protein